jgi:hypothetical protein
MRRGSVAVFDALGFRGIGVAVRAGQIQAQSSTVWARSVTMHSITCENRSEAIRNF